MDLTGEIPIGGWLTPTSAYLHVPFCRHRCGYCNFSVIADRDSWIDRYLSAIDRELETLDRPQVTTIFLGGGTPTHLNEAQLDQLFNVIETRFEMPRDIEWSVEANPEDITLSKLNLLINRGVNRISLGIQSFCPTKLQQLERGHTSQDAIRAIELTASRLNNISIDLIFAAPGERIDTWRRDLEIALSLPIRHLSTYALTYEKGTQFWNRRHHGTLQPIDEAQEVDMYQLARQLAVDHGMDHYEISSFSQSGARCRHNLAYWRGTGWFAAGPGAARFTGGVREVNHRSTSTYLRRVESGQSPVAESEMISLEQYARERAAFGIRMIDGFDIHEISDTVGFDVAEKCDHAIKQSIDEDLLITDGDGHLRLSEKGILFADTVASRLLG